MGRRSEAPGGAVYVATETFATVDDAGAPLVVHKGATRVREGHGLLDRYPHYFEEANLHVHYDIEAATAEPGELRGEDPHVKVAKAAPGEVTAAVEDRGPGKAPVRGAEKPKIEEKPKAAEKAGDKEAKS